MKTPKGHMCKETRRRIDARKDFVNEGDVDDNLERLHAVYRPEGSGPLGAMATICALIELLQEERAKCANFRLV